MAELEHVGMSCAANCASRLVRLWPEAAQIDVRSNVGYWGLSGLFVLKLRLVVHDPQGKSHPLMRRHAIVALPVGSEDGWSRRTETVSPISNTIKSSPTASRPL